MSEMTEAKKNAINSLIDAWNELKRSGIKTSLTEQINMDNGEMVMLLEVEGLNIREAAFMTGKIVRLEDNAT